MGVELSPEQVSIRLDRLRALWKPLTQDEARAFTEDPAGLTQRESFQEAVARRLDELRALSEMTMALRPASGQEPEPAR